MRVAAPLTLLVGSASGERLLAAAVDGAWAVDRYIGHVNAGDQCIDTELDLVASAQRVVPDLIQKLLHIYVPTVNQMRGSLADRPPA